MNYINFGEDIKISQVVMGCMRVKDAGISDTELRGLVERCIEHGIDSFDHAPVYGGYSCEEIFGNAVLKDSPGLRDKIKLITKTGIALPGREGNRTIYYNSTAAYIEKEVEESLRKLQTDYIDVLLVHRPDVLADPAETGAALDKLVAGGKVRGIGVSNYTPAEISALQSKMKAPLITNQVELSVKHTDHFFDGTISYGLEKEMPFMAWSPAGGGSVFTGRDEQSMRLREKLTEISEKHDTAIDAVMYAWLFRHPARIAVITGSMKWERIRAAADGIKTALSYDDWYQILEASRGYPVP